MTMTRTAMPGPVPEVPCVCAPHWTQDVGCMCSDEERFLRHGGPFTPEQREWCLAEIHSVEGYDRARYEKVDDKQLGRTVLEAWIDYCRDKGLM